MNCRYPVSDSSSRSVHLSRESQDSSSDKMNDNLSAGTRASMREESSSRPRNSMHVDGRTVFSGWKRNPSCWPSAIIQSTADSARSSNVSGGKI